MLRLILLRSAQSQTGSHSDSFTLRPTHTQTHSRSYLLTRIPTQTQARSHSNQLTLRIRRCQTCDWLALILADCGNVSSERFALAHMRPLTDIHRKMCQENEMHIWGAPRRVIIGRPRRKEEHTPHPSPPPLPFQSSLRLPHHSDSLVTQTHSSLRPTHHSDSLITQTHSSLGLSHDSDSSLITQTHSSLRLTHHSDSLVLVLIHSLHSLRSTHRMTHTH